MDDHTYIVLVKFNPRTSSAQVLHMMAVRAPTACFVVADAALTHATPLQTVGSQQIGSAY
jgi:hypothetical protein